MNPLTIYQSAINAVSAAVLADDFAAFLVFYDLPYLIRTSQAHFILKTAEEIEPTFRSVARALANAGVTHYERVAREADYLGADRIVGWHYTHMISNGERIVEPHATSEVLVRRNDRWLFTEANCPLITDQWPWPEEAVIGPKAPSTFPQHREGGSLRNPGQLS